ncbi:PGPGW domain-containing protein [Granulicoccus sp. GXG6511]|uniref:PGPGW domain-containing protein n=1 Tax=Granulicoccus sp. GXG6511 TaxID=3381351 RepID=UPI003D7E182C
MRAERDESEEDRPGATEGLDKEAQAITEQATASAVTRDSSEPDADHAEPDADEAESDSGLHLPHLPHIRPPNLIEPEEDRWRWRAKIRRDPRKLFFYRIGVGIAGLVLMIAAALTGPLPGPGGIPLFLLGLAIWSSEFERANRLMGWFKRQFDRYRGWSRGRRVLFWAVVIVCAWAFFYLGMLIYGIPLWLPDAAQEWLQRLPGVR